MLWYICRKMNSALSVAEVLFSDLIKVWPASASTLKNYQAYKAFISSVHSRNKKAQQLEYLQTGWFLSPTFCEKGAKQCMVKSFFPYQALDIDQYKACMTSNPLQLPKNESAKYNVDQEKNNNEDFGRRTWLTHRSGSVPEVPVVGVSVWVPVVVGNGHIIQTVMLRWRRSGVRQTIGLVRQAIIWTVPLAWANSARPLAWMLWVQRLSVKAIFFGSEI